MERLIRSARALACLHPILKRAKSTSKIAASFGGTAQDAFSTGLIQNHSLTHHRDDSQRAIIAGRKRLRHSSRSSPFRCLLMGLPYIWGIALMKMLRQFLWLSKQNLCVVIDQVIDDILCPYNRPHARRAKEARERSSHCVFIERTVRKRRPNNVAVIGPPRPPVKAHKKRFLGIRSLLKQRWILGQVGHHLFINKTS